MAENYNEKNHFSEDNVLIAIGASADGIKYLEKFFKQVPQDESSSFVVIQHQMPDMDSYLGEILGRSTSLSIRDIENGLEIRSGHIYISPPGSYVSITNNQFHTEKLSKQKKHLRLPIDHFFRSVSVSKMDKVVGVILSGTGSDGSLGIKEIKSEGGLVVVQEPEDLKFREMPDNAIATQLADVILPVEKMPHHIREYIQQRAQKGNAFNQPETPGLLKELHKIIKERTRRDFKDYKENTLFRRISRRMAVQKAGSLKKYVEILKNSEEEVQMLYNDLLIGVTSFFRDKDAFHAIYDHVLPRLFETDENRPVRIWVAACATGEEAYTLAILVKEYMKSNNLHQHVQIFATDIDENALENARTGKYSVNVQADIPGNFLDNYFLKMDNHYQVHKDLRDMIVFANHDLLSDPPYSRIDLVSCRNFLIYLNKNRQEHVFNVFSYALKHEGYLFLGKSESKSSLESFEMLNPKWKIFIKRKDRKAIYELFTNSKFGQFDRDSRYHPPKKAKSLPQIAHEIATKKFINPLLFVDEAGTVLYSLGKCGDFFEFPVGDPTNRVQDIAVEGLRIPLLNALKKVSSDKTNEAQYQNIKVLKGESIEVVNLVVRKLIEYPRLKGIYIIHLIPQNNISLSAKKPPLEADIDQDKQEYIRELEADLKEAREYLKNVIEELEIANEELKSTNEEAQSTNEELQSSNEELETAKEETQSLNEELETANDELQRKIKELSHLNDDLSNFLTSTQIGTVFLDKDLIIRRYTRHINSILDLADSDIGRPIEKFAINYENQDLISNVKKVLENLIPIEKEITATNQRNFWMRILPYRTVQDKIEGVVVTFTDITELKKAQEKAASHEKQYKLLFSHMNSGFALCKLVEKQDKKVFEFYDINSVFRKLFHFINFEEVRFSDILPGNIRQGVMNTAMEVAENGFSKVEERYFENIDKHLRLHYFSHKENHFALLVEDITTFITELQTRQHLSSIVESSDDAIYSESPEGRILSWNKAAECLYGYTEAEIEGKLSRDFFASEKFDHNSELLEKVRQGETVQSHETLHKTKSGKVIPVSITKSPIKDANNKVLAISNIVKDNTFVKEREKALVKAKEATEKASRLKSNFLANMSHEIRTPLNSILGYTNILKEESIDEKHLKFVNIIDNSGRQLLQLINDIVDVSRLEAGELSLQISAVDVIKTVQEIYEELAYQTNTASASVNFQLQIPKEVSRLYLKTDETHLRQILHNLLSNAFKYTEKGSIKFGFELEVNNEKIIFFVKDTGIGISEEYKKKIFHRFSQGEQLSQKVVRGTGLGLAISQGLTSVLNGKLWLESEKGKGSKFYVSLPLDITEEGEGKEEDEKMEKDKELKTYADKKILLVEDDEYSMEMMKYMLERHDIKCVVAIDGPEALEKFEGEKTDLILLDLRIPKLSGYEVLKKIRSKNKDIPVIAQSAFAMAEDIHKAKASGFTDYITKPISMDKLDKLLEKYLGQNGQEEK